ncbi:uncharacterized protein FOMMEDRAFT_156975 [Fomitiporia mediterranea MF3/22]|uniref:uncharacterized protein n=1 Tax=Fomitiporia mediterranea (strain MF3/22) TaxID=694068 RepID=UPI0004408DBD|nr:uncharacterized protein FOMMEDRAFT_156975 [Fomitiporia mediterranea MF3/22]EJD01848.1 hypothetical protein FOMMEDRAFT_156975 [Fomitiporia mediterranea MF3/22]
MRLRGEAPPEALHLSTRFTPNRRGFGVRDSPRRKVNRVSESQGESNRKTKHTTLHAQQGAPIGQMWTDTLPKRKRSNNKKLLKRFDCKQQQGGRSAKKAFQTTYAHEIRAKSTHNCVAMSGGHAFSTHEMNLSSTPCLSHIQKSRLAPQLNPSKASS